jgi:hypothetical protein
MGGMSKLLLTDRMVRQIHVSGFHVVFRAFDVWFSLQDLLFFPTYFVAFFIRKVGRLELRWMELRMILECLV